MTDAPLSPASPDDIADSLAFALSFAGRKRTHDADELMAKIVARRLVEHLDRAGFVVMKRPPSVGGGGAGAGLRGPLGIGRATFPRRSELALSGNDHLRNAGDFYAI
jgi:hypothetical protein